MTLEDKKADNEYAISESSVSSVLLQSTATTRNSLTTIAAASAGRTSFRAFGRVLCAGQLSGRLRRLELDIVVHPPQSEVDGESLRSCSWRVRRGDGRLDHGPDQQAADENSVRSQSRRDAVQEIV